MRAKGLVLMNKVMGQMKKVNLKQCVMILCVSTVMNMVAISASAQSVASLHLSSSLSQPKSTNAWLQSISDQLSQSAKNDSKNWTTALSDLKSSKNTQITAFSPPDARMISDIQSLLKFQGDNGSSYMYSNISPNSHSSGGAYYQSNLASVVCGQPGSKPSSQCLPLAAQSSQVLRFNGTSLVQNGEQSYLKALLGQIIDTAGIDNVGASVNNSSASEKAAQSMVVQVLGHIAAQNNVLHDLNSKYAYPTKYKAASNMLLGLYQSPLISNLSTQTNQIQLLKTSIALQLFTTLTQRVLMEEAQTKNALAAASLAQQTRIQKLLASLLVQQQKMNKHLALIAANSKRK